MKKTKVDLTDIKSNDLDDTATFTDLMSKKERKNKNDDIEDMVNEKKRNTKDLTNDIKLAKEEIKKDKEIDNTKIIDIEEKKDRKNKKEKKEIKKDKEPLSIITDIGIFILIAMSYFVYCLLYTNVYDRPKLLLLNIYIIILLFILYAIAILFNKLLYALQIVIIIVLLGFIGLNIITTLGII